MTLTLKTIGLLHLGNLSEKRLPRATCWALRCPRRGVSLWLAESRASGTRTGGECETPDVAKKREKKSPLPTRRRSSYPCATQNGTLRFPWISKDEENGDGRKMDHSFDLGSNATQHGTIFRATPFRSSLVSLCFMCGWTSLSGPRRYFFSAKSRNSVVVVWLR